MRRIGVFLDDFDPFRFDHLSLASAAEQGSGLEDIVFVPLPHADKKEKNRNRARIDQRYRMCVIGLLGREGMEMIPFDMVYQAGSVCMLIKKIRRTYTDAKCFFILSDSLLLRLSSQTQFKGIRDSAFLYYRTSGFAADEVLETLQRDGLDVSAVDCEGTRIMLDRDCRRQFSTLRDPEWIASGELSYIAQEGLYLPDGRRQLQKMLNAHRWQHSLGVQSVAISLALQYHGPILRVSQAALYHDCAKCLNLKEMRRIAETHQLTDNEEMLHSGALLHGPVGAVVAEETFALKDPEALDAIRYHTTGRENMTLTDLIVFVADAIEPNREDYPGLAKIRELARVSLRAAALESLYTTRNYVTSRGKPFHGQGLKTIAWLESILTEQEKEWMQIQI